VTLAPGLELYEKGLGTILNTKITKGEKSKLSFITTPVDGPDSAKLNVRFMDATNLINS